MFKKRRKRTARPKLRKAGGIYFLTLIPLSLLLGLVALVNLIFILIVFPLNSTAWALFVFGFIAATSIVSTMKLHKLRTFIHELKHAVVVIFTGNRLREFHVEKHTGHVSYDLLMSRAHFAPLIILAPYFYPILSLPCLAVCLFYEQSFPELLSILLGACLATDIVMGYQEIHSNQTDLKQIFGGFFIAGLFIVTIQFMWSCICLLWVSDGLEAYKFSFYNTVSIVTEYFKLIDFNLF